MDNRWLYQLWKKVRPIRPWYFLAIALVSGGICIVSLRSNNLHMEALREAVYAADKNNANVTGALQDLQAYVTTHMNTDLANGPNAPYPPIQLVYTYDRAVLAAGEKVSQANARIYNDAQHYCEKVDTRDYYGTNRVPCVEQYIHNHGVTNVPVIPDSLYKFAFVSPVWSPDPAGWSLLVAMASGATFIIMVLIRWLLRTLSK